MTDVFSALTGTGDLLLPAARFVPLVGVDVTTFPPGAAVMDTTTPRRVMKVGWIAPGRLGSDPSWPASLFFEDARWIDFERELFTYPTPGIFCDRIRFHLEPGAVASIYVNDTGVPAVPNALLMPWDRNPTPVTSLGALNILGGQTDTIAFTYTVPSGKRLKLDRIHNHLTRFQAATAIVQAVSYLLMNASYLSLLTFASNVLGESISDNSSVSELILPAGSTIEAHTYSGDTGGYVNCSIGFAGTLFDA